MSLTLKFLDSHGEVTRFNRHNLLLVCVRDDADSIVVRASSGVQRPVL